MWLEWIRAWTGKVDQGLDQGEALESECLLKLCPYLILVLTLTWKHVLGDGDGKVELYGRVQGPETLPKVLGSILQMRSH